jgi:hypothetical protein
VKGTKSGKGWRRNIDGSSPPPNPQKIRVAKIIDTVEQQLSEVGIKIKKVEINVKS